jgi:hypothetical protein
MYDPVHRNVMGKKVEKKKRKLTKKKWRIN